MKIAKILLTAAALAVVLGGSAYAKTLVYCSEASPANFDPGTTTGGNDYDAGARTVYNRLVEFKHGSTEVEPGLAESWEISADGLTYTFHLHPGVKFQTTDFFTPTRDFNADDVIFSFMRQQDDKSPWFTYLPNLSYDYYQGMDMPKYTKEWKKIDDNTVQLDADRAERSDARQPRHGFRLDPLQGIRRQVSQAAEHHAQTALAKPVGTGPFTFVAYQQDAVIRYKANPDYWKGKVKIDDLIFQINTDATTRLQKACWPATATSWTTRTRPTCRRSRPTPPSTCSARPASTSAG